MQQWIKTAAALTVSALTACTSTNAPSDIGGSDVQFLDIAFRIGAGMLFVTKFVEAVFLCPTGIFVLTRCGLAADLSFFIDFYGLTLFAAGGLNNGGINDGGGCLLYF